MKCIYEVFSVYMSKFISIMVTATGTPALTDLRPVCGRTTVSHEVRFWRPQVVISENTGSQKSFSSHLRITDTKKRSWSHYEVFQLNTTNVLFIFCSVYSVSSLSSVSFLSVCNVIYAWFFYTVKEVCCRQTVSLIKLYIKFKKNPRSMSRMSASLSWFQLSFCVNRCPTRHGPHFYPVFSRFCWTRCVTVESSRHHSCCECLQTVNGLNPELKCNR